MNNIGSDFKKLVAGNWNNTSNAGLFYRNLNNNRSNSNNNYGFRSVDYKLLSETKTVTELDTEIIGNSDPSSEKFAEYLTLPKMDLSAQTLYEQIISLDNLYEAYLNTKKHKLGTRRVYNVEKDIGTVLRDLRTRLLNDTYKVSPCFMFTVYEPKERLISSPRIIDSIVQHAIYRVIYSSIDKKLIHDSHGCRKGKGAHSASKSLQNYMRLYDEEYYIIQIDIRKYYFSIDHEILKSQLSRFIPCTKTVDLMMQFVNQSSNVGLNVGNLLSQLYGLIYLNQFDHFVKRRLKVKHYIRYVDDMVFVGYPTLESAKSDLDTIVTYLREELKLELSKFHIKKIKKGVNFVGFRTWKKIKLIRKRSLYNFNKALKSRNVEAMNSLLGHAKNTSTFKYLFELVIKELESTKLNLTKLNLTELNLTKLESTKLESHLVRSTKLETKIGVTYEYDSEIQKVYDTWSRWVYNRVKKYR